jgi:protein PhnA
LRPHKVNCNAGHGYDFSHFTAMQLRRHLTIASHGVTCMHVDAGPVLNCHTFSKATSSRDAMTTLPPCPECGSEYSYQDGEMLVCPECAHEWNPTAAGEATDQPREVRDAHGTVLQDGDSVTVIKDLKIKGSSSVVKVGTKVRNIRLVDGDHDIDCRIDGIGPMGLKSEFVKKA